MSGYIPGKKKENNDYLNENESEIIPETKEKRIKNYSKSSYKDDENENENENEEIKYNYNSQRIYNNNNSRIILKYGNNRNNYYDKIIYLNQKDKLNKISFIQKEFLKKYYTKKYTQENLKNNLKENKKGRIIYNNKNELQFTRNKSFDVLQNKDEKEENENNKNDKNINKKLSPTMEKIKKSLEEKIEKANKIKNKMNEEEEDEKMNSIRNNKRNLSSCKSVDETISDSSNNARQRLLRRILKKQNKKYMSDLQQPEKDFKKNEKTKKMLINISKRFLPTILIKIFNLHWERYLITILNHRNIKERKKILLLSFFNKRLNQLRRYLYRWLGPKNKKILNLIQYKLSDSIYKKRTKNLFNTLLSIFYKNFFYRLVLLYLFKKGIDFNSNILITFLNKGFNHRYLFTLYQCLLLKLTNNSNYPQSDYSLINYIRTIDEMNNSNNKEKINKYFNENHKNQIYKKKSINKSFDKQSDISIDDYDKNSDSFKGSLNLSNYSIENLSDINLNGTYHSQRPPVIISKTINLKKDK